MVLILFFCITLICFAFAFISTYICNRQDQCGDANKEDTKEIEEFVSSLQQKRMQKVSQFKKRADRKAVKLAMFDPNQVDSIELSTLGLPWYVVRNILKYRAAGGMFKDAISLSRIYGMDSSTFRRIKPFISIAVPASSKRDTFAIKSKDSIHVYKFAEPTIVDLNSADTSLLKMIPGIGSGLARMIVAYRKRLGGFYTVDQLDEIGYIDNSLHKWFSIVETEIETINVNKASLDRLRNHPYMDFYKAKVILEYRKRRGKIKNLSQLALFEEFTEKDINRLSKYLSFD